MTSNLINVIVCLRERVTFDQQKLKYELVILTDKNFMCL